MSRLRKNTFAAAFVAALACLPVPVAPLAAAAHSGPDPVLYASPAIVPATARLARQRRYATARMRRSWLRGRLRAWDACRGANATERRPRCAMRAAQARGPPCPAAMADAYPQRGGHVPPRSRVRH